MKWLEVSISRLVRARGVAVVWELTLLIALWPYIVGLPVAGISFFHGAAAPLTVALSLCVTIVLTCALRAALEAGWGSEKFAPAADGGGVSKPAQSAGPNSVMDRDALSDLIDRYDSASGAASLATIRFSNYAPMAAYDAAAASHALDEFTRRLKHAVGGSRPVGQLSDDCFAVWFGDGEGRATVETQLRAIAYVLDQEIAQPELTIAPALELGVVAYPVDADNAAALIARAHAALVPFKRFSTVIKSDGPVAPPFAPGEEFGLEQALRRAVRDGQLSLKYQPFVDVASGRVVGAEALLRWHHPTLGDVSPARFVPLLEQTGLVHEIGVWTLNAACRQARLWREQGSQDLRLAINLSAVQLQNPSLKVVFERIVASHGLRPADIELELTETAAMEDRSRTIELFQELRAEGFGIAIDDFGNGHSNLSYLKGLPFTKLKIDREFISHVDTDSGSEAICKALIELGRGLGISVLAEGVERHEEVSTLRRLGCHVFQGFYFARPMSADQVTKKLSDPDWLALIGSDVHRSRAELQRRIVS